jgi:hypothetical protein
VLNIKYKLVPFLKYKDLIKQLKALKTDKLLVRYGPNNSFNNNIFLSNDFPKCEKVGK